MREKLNQLMAGLEAGLLLFTSDCRAVMVSQAAQKFLGAPSDQFLGRCAPEIFPPGHPLRHALQLDGDGLHPVAAAEAEVPTRKGPSARAEDAGGLGKKESGRHWTPYANAVCSNAV